MRKKSYTDLYNALNCWRKRTNPSEPTKFGAQSGKVTDRGNKRDRERPENDKSRCDGVRNGNADLQKESVNERFNKNEEIGKGTFISYGLRLRLAHITSEG